MTPPPVRPDRPARPATLQLRSPDRTLERAFMAMVEDFRATGEEHLVDEAVLLHDGFAAYVEWLECGARGEVPGLAPWQAWWAVDAASQRVVGTSALRHPLTPWTAEFAGHIGYRVRPSRRREGLGTRILALTLARARTLGLARALMVCEPGNAGSIGVLQANGAAFERDVVTHGMTLHRYWASTGASATTGTETGDERACPSSSTRNIARA